MKPVPIGVYGEVYIGGTGTARGYLNRPELTAEKFIEHRSYIFYKTGDLARRLTDGNIEFLGRIDQQVKIRGFRIEPGEIEQRLLEIEGITEALVIHNEIKNGERYLCAYIVSASEIDIAGLRRRLSARLPDYMIPSYFIPLEKIPLTPNGKVDRKRLPEPEIVPGADYAGPRDEIEERMVDMWSDVLGIEKEKIGVTANFFELGGHSLKATTLAARIHRVFDTDIPLEMIFRKPTIRELAEYISGAAKAPFISIQPVEKKEYYKLSSAQKRLFIIRQMGIESIGYNIPLPMVLEGELDKAHLEETIRKLIKRHESLRTSFVMINREPVQRIHEDVKFSIEYHDLAAKDKGKIHNSKFIIQNSFVRPFDLSQAPLLRVGLFQLEKHKHVLIMDMHHIITDGSSLPVLSRELIDLYVGKELQPVRIQYKDFARWQNDRKEGRLKKEEEYWLNVFKAGVPVLNLPFDYPRPALQSFAGHQVDFVVDSENAKQLREMATNHGATLYMLFLAIYNVLLAKLSGQDDIVVGTPIAGRRHAELEHIVGMFVNTLVLRNYPKADRPFNEFLREVRKTTLAAFDNQDYQFEELVEKITIERDPGRNPLFDAAFSFNRQDIDKSSPLGPAGEVTQVKTGLKVSAYSGDQPIQARFDILLTGVDTGEELFLSIQYSTELFKEETIKRFIKYFKEIVSAVMTNESIQLKNINISHNLLMAKSTVFKCSESTFDF